MGNRLEGKVAIITGASRGLGEYCAVGYGREGAKVVVAARTEQLTDPNLPGTIYDTAKLVEEAGGEALPLVCNVADAASIQAMVDKPPEWLEEWGRQVGAKLQDGLREAPAFIAFARENGRVYHTYTVQAPDPFVAPYHSFLLARTPKPGAAEPRAWRKDEYPD